jgi:inosine-uridine nucleoside N-ribohydrolase
MARPLRVHLDTDIGGDTDDLCALALLFGSPGVEIVGITTVADRDGGRLTFVRRALELAGRVGVPIASGAFDFLGGVPHKPGLNDERYWPGLAASPPTSAGLALDLLQRNAESGATIVAIGPYTNLGILETMRPGVFANADVVVMGGWHRVPPTGHPAWDHHRDYNVQADRVAARIVFERLNPLVVPIDITAQTWIRRRELAVLQQGGPLSHLMARQAELYAVDNRYIGLAAQHAALPDDLLNFQHDPLACAVAIGWDCVTIEEMALGVAERDGALLLEQAPGAKPLRIVTGVDSEAFQSSWLETVAHL